VYAVNCQFKGTDRIVRIKTARGRGGAIENLWFKDLSGEAIANEAIHLNMLYTGNRLPAQTVSRGTPSIRNIHFENVTCTSGKSFAVEILGLPEMPVENVWFNRINVHTVKGVNISDAKGIHFSNPTISASGSPLISITDGFDVSIDSLSFPGEIDQLLRVEGTNSRMIIIRGTKIQNPDKLVSLGPAVAKQAVLIEE
jgi:DNA sulfur modification protein DndE